MYGQDPTWTGPAADFARALRAIRHAASTTDTRYGLNGVHVDVVDAISPSGSTGACLRVVATDGHRLALEDVHGTGVLGLLARRSLLSLDGVVGLVDALDAHTLRHDGSVLVDVFARSGTVCVGGLPPEAGFESLGVPMQDGEFPDYRSVVPTKARVTATVPRAALIAAVKAATPKAYKQPNWPTHPEPETVCGFELVGPRYVREDGSFVQRTTSRGRKWMDVNASRTHASANDGLDVALGSRGRAADVSVPSVTVRFDYDAGVTLLPVRAPYAPTDTVWPDPVTVPADGYGFDTAARWTDGVTFDAKYLREALASLTGKTVEIMIDHALAPCCLRAGAGLRLVMPRRLG